MVDDRYKDGFPLDYKEPRKEDALDKVWNYFKSFPSKLYGKSDTWRPRPSSVNTFFTGLGWVAKPTVTIAAGVATLAVGAPALVAGGVAIAAGHYFGKYYDKLKEDSIIATKKKWEKERDIAQLKKFRKEPNKYCVLEFNMENSKVFVKEGQRNVESNIYKDLVIASGNYRFDISGGRNGVSFLEDEVNGKAYVVFDSNFKDGMYLNVRKLGSRPEESYDLCHVSDDNCNSNIERIAKLNIIKEGFEKGEIELPNDFNYSKMDYVPNKKGTRPLESEKPLDKEKPLEKEEPVEKFSFHRNKPSMSKGNSDFWKSNEKDAYSNDR